jgi:dATP pyrophosphohydrolase
LDPVNPKRLIQSPKIVFKASVPKVARARLGPVDPKQRIQNRNPDSKGTRLVAAIVSRVVEACVFKISREGPHYLLLKRSDGDPIYPGMWQMVTGSMKEGERALDAALREFREETGMVPVRFWVVPFVNSFYVAVNDAIHLSPVFAVEASDDATVALSDEHQEYAWCSFEDAQRKLVWPGQRYAVELVHEYIVGGQEAARLLSIHV